ncbi:MAG: nucleotidyl transferase AbiEii/AbiGii toxin family protein [Saprospirales bacterium]|nr:nucleotidyl transferase AbiEii/AbiGii toxin family protein [Saprospirales bacterium]
MLSLSEIKLNYPEQLRDRGEFLLREYLQCKILELIFQSDFASKFAFLGGTCLRIVHNNQRFSEDLDFDNFDLSEKDFESVAELIRKGLEEQGLRIEMRNVIRGAYHCYIRFPGLLFEAGLSGHKEAKILINLDTEAQNFPFETKRFLLNRFDVVVNIHTTPPDILLSQKIAAITQRRQPKGRDFFDALFLWSFVKPNYEFLIKKLDISDSADLKRHLIGVCEKFDFDQLASDVEPFLFDPMAVRRVLLFPDFIKTGTL